MTAPTIEQLFAECAAATLSGTRATVWLQYDPAGTPLERYTAIVDCVDDKGTTAKWHGPWAPEPYSALIRLRESMREWGKPGVHTDSRNGHGSDR